MKKTLRITCVLCIWILSSCTFPPLAPAPLSPDFVLVTANPNASPTPTPFQPAANTATPVESPTLLPADTPVIPTDTPIPTLPPATNPPPATAQPPSSRTQYTMFVLLDYSGHRMAVDETIVYTNQTGAALNELVLAVEPNLKDDSFSLETLFIDGSPVNYDLSGQEMTVYLPQPLAPSAKVTLAMRFLLAIPPKRFEYPYGYLGYQVNLTDWYPFVVPYSNGWILHDPWPLGEHLVYDSSDFEVNIKTTDTGITLAASAPAEPNGEWTRYRLFGARTFVFSASDRYEISESAVGSVVIRTYYFNGYEGAGEGMLDAAVRAVGLFEAKFGPYPYQSLSVVQTDMTDGQEYDGLVFLATKFYDEYGGSARSNMVAIGVHEIAHQWWFGLVGSDQAMEPWLDEAMSVYSEAIFYEYIYPRYGDWWWNFRVNYFGPTGWVDTTIYESGTFRAYVNATYLNGANFIDALRIRIGDEAFFDFLKDYASRYAYSRVTANDFFALLRQHTSADLSGIESTYFRGSY